MDKNSFEEHKPKKVYPQIIFLTQQELDKLENHTFQSEALTKGKDCYLFCCYTGLAYKEMFELRKDDLLKISKYMVEDAYFSKITFVKPFVEAGFHIISRLRDDADLQYVFARRPQKYAGKIDFENLDRMFLAKYCMIELGRKLKR